MALPAFNEVGDLPPGVHRATMPEILERFGHGTVQRRAVADRLSRIYQLADSTGQWAQSVIFGSFVTAKADPNDVDVVLIMEDNFDLSAVTGEATLVFQHTEADSHFGASVFWTKRSGAFGGEQAMVEYWQVRREGGTSGHYRSYWGDSMIANDRELQTTLDRVAWFQKQVAQLRKTESNPENYRAAVSGFVAEIDRMQLEVREYMRFLPSETVKNAEPDAAPDRSGMVVI